MIIVLQVCDCFVGKELHTVLILYFVRSAVVIDISGPEIGGKATIERHPIVEPAFRRACVTQVPFAD